MKKSLTLKPKAKLNFLKTLLVQNQAANHVDEWHDAFIVFGSIFSTSPLKAKFVQFGARTEEDKNEHYVGVRLYNKYGVTRGVYYFQEKAFK